MYFVTLTQFILYHLKQLEELNFFKKIHLESKFKTE